MKKLLVTILALITIFSATACLTPNSNSNYNDYKDVIEPAITSFTTAVNNYDMKIQNLSLTGVRIIYIKEDTEIEYFRNVNYIVEMIGFCNYFEPDNPNAKYLTHLYGLTIPYEVVVKKDGLMENTGRFINRWQASSLIYETSYVKDVIYVQFETQISITLSQNIA